MVLIDAAVAQSHTLWICRNFAMAAGYETRICPPAIATSARPYQAFPASPETLDAFVFLVIPNQNVFQLCLEIASVHQLYMRCIIMADGMIAYN